VLAGAGNRRERKGSPLANSWRQRADALSCCSVCVHTGTPDSVSLDASPLRDAAAAAAARAEALLIVGGDAPLLSDFEGEPPGDEPESPDAAVWALQPLLLSWQCADRAAAKALAARLAAALGGPTVQRSTARPGRRLIKVEDEL